MKKLILLSIILIVGCATMKDVFVRDKSTAFFVIGMTEEEFIRKNPQITEKISESGESSTYIESCQENKYVYLLFIKIPARCEEYMFEFKNDTLIAVYRGRNNYNRPIDYSKYPNSTSKWKYPTTNYYYLYYLLLGVEVMILLK